MGKIGAYVKGIKEGKIKEIRHRLKWVYGYAKNYWKQMIIYVLIGLSGTVVSLLSSFVSRDMVDIVTGHKAGAVISTFAIMIGVALGNSFISNMSNYISTKISLKVDTEIKSDIFEKILVTDWESLATYHTGDLLVRWNSDVTTISNGILNFVPNIIIFSFRFISALVVMAVNDWSFALIAFVSMPFSLLISRHMVKQMRDNNIKSMEISSRMNGFNQETFSNIQTIKAFSLVPEYTKRLHGLQKEYIKNRLKFQRAFIVIAMINVLLSLIVSYAAYGWGIYRVWSGAITYGSMTMFLSLSSSLTSTFNGLLSLAPILINMSTSAGRLMDIVEMPREDYSNDPDVKAFAAQNKETGISLRIDGTDYSYRNGNEVFKDVSIKADPHEVIALVGPSGEGKTTMLRLILALISGKNGDNYLLGKNSFINEKGETTDRVPLNAASRQLFSYVPQGNTMLSGTIAENMRFVKPDATDEEIWEALDMACAKDFVEKMPKGLDSILKERGGGISEGQAQRLSIARAIIRKSPLLLLDEATSALDVATERRVLKNIMKDEYPRTLIVTTHRPTVLNACDRVYAIKDKKCVILNDEEIDEMVRGF